MKQIIFSIFFALVSFSAMGQTLSVQPIEAKAGEQATLAVSLSGATAMTALQFNLALPEGVTLAGNEATQGAATNGHTLDVETLDNGDHLFILYNIDLNTFKDGESLRIPVIIGSNAKSSEGSLYTVRFSTTEAVSSEGSNAQFNVTITGSTLGDVNGDGSITAQDASLVLQLVAKKISSTTEGIIYNAADVNGDGEVTAQDASLILQHVAKKIDLSNLNK